MTDPFQRNLDHVYKGTITIPDNLVRFRVTGGVKPYISAIKPTSIARKMAYWQSRGLTAVPMKDNPIDLKAFKDLPAIEVKPVVFDDEEIGFLDFDGE